MGLQGSEIRQDNAPPSPEDEERALLFLGGGGSKRSDGNIRLPIYQALLRSTHPLTARELADLIAKGTSPNNVSSRLNEMRRYGLVEMKGQTKCPITGKRVFNWGVVQKVPDPIVFVEPKKWYMSMRDGRPHVVISTKDVTRASMIRMYGPPVLCVMECSPPEEED